MPSFIPRSFMLALAMVPALTLPVRAQTVADAVRMNELPPPGTAPCNCACPQRPTLGSLRELPAGTTDIHSSLGISGGDSYAGNVRILFFDVAVTHRFKQHGAYRFAVESTGVALNRQANTALFHASAFVGRSTPMTRAFVGVSGWSLRVGDDYGGTVPTGGVLGVVRFELGRALGPHLNIGGGTGFSPTPRTSYVESALGFAGEAEIQIPVRAAHAEFVAVRLVSRWFGSMNAVYGETGFDIVGAGRLDGRHPAILVGYRWTAAWTAFDASTHGLHIGAEWYGLGARRVGPS